MKNHHRNAKLKINIHGKAHVQQKEEAQLKQYEILFPS